jgi:hypothetical protein
MSSAATDQISSNNLDNQPEITNTRTAAAGPPKWKEFRLVTLLTIKALGTKGKKTSIQHARGGSPSRRRSRVSLPESCTQRCHRAARPASPTFKDISDSSVPVWVFEHSKRRRAPTSSKQSPKTVSES